MGPVLLAGAILAEVGGTLALRAASAGRRAWYLPVAVGYAVSFVLLSAALAYGVPLGVAYGIWSAVGVALTAVASRVLFKEPLTLLMSGGIVLIIGGVLLIELASSA